MSIKITLSGTAIRLELIVSAEGFRLQILRPRVKPRRESDDWLTLGELRSFLHRHNMNIFPDVDTFAYVQRADRPELRLSYKHEPMANHTYAAMGYFCQTHHFQRSVWNRLAGRREAIVQVRQIVENRAAEPFAAVRVTPADAYGVRVEEVCTALTELVLEYHMEPAVQEFSCDMFELLTAQSVDKSKKKQANTSAVLQWHVIELLRAVQPLSYS